MSFHNKKRALIVGIFIFLSSILFLCIRIPQLAPLSPQKRILPEDISNILQDGDIICRLGDRLWSLYFKDVSPNDKRFSHLGIIRVNDTKITVINAEGRAIQGKDFVNEVDLDEFLEIAKAVGIYRLKNFDGKKVSSTALEYIGYPFDWNFNLEDEKKIYCTELLYIILKKIAPEIEIKKIFQKELKKEIIPLEAYSNSEYFTEIVFISVE
jgi:uncharacterized protein YycO